MSERKRFILLCLLLIASISLLVIITQHINGAFSDQF